MSGYKTSAPCCINLPSGRQTVQVQARLSEILPDGVAIYTQNPVPVGIEVGFLVNELRLPEQRIRVAANEGDSGRGYRMILRLAKGGWPYQVFSQLMTLPMAEEIVEPPACFVELGLSVPCTVSDVERAYYAHVRNAHPDRGGDIEAFVKLRSAYLEALELLGGRR